MAGKTVGSSVKFESLGASHKRKAEKFSESEYQAQATVIQWAKAHEHLYPELKLLKGNMEGISLGGSIRQRAITIAKMKASGMRPGWPDLELPVARGAFPALFIEMKVGNNKTSEEQNRYLDLLRDAGNAVYVSYGSAQAIRTISSYLGIK